MERPEDKVQRIVLPWTAEDGSRWQVDVDFAFIGARYECVGFGVRSYPVEPQDARQLGELLPLKATVMRSVPYGTLVRQAMRKAAGKAEFALAVVEVFGDQLPDKAAAHKKHVQDVGAWRRPPKRRRLPNYTDADVARVAAVYTAAFAAHSDHPTQDVAEQLGIPRNSAAKLVMRCRQRGLLAPTDEGVAGGILPPGSD